MAGNLSDVNGYFFNKGITRKPYAKADETVQIPIRIYLTSIPCKNKNSITF